MYAWAKSLLSITLICYIAVSSVAAVHAFPKTFDDSVNIGDVSTSSSGASLAMTLNCHQQQNGDESQNSISSCKIFCAAMTSVMSNDFIEESRARILYSEIAFIDEGLHTRELSLEPQPPK